MEIYQVGGAVRDELLGIEPAEKDWVVVGATPEDMKALGYRQVGRDFPVFLHPETHEEYALARTERKTHPGHTGFVFHAGPEVTLEQDLRRRDLTVNAIARDRDGRLIDAWGGRRDLEQRLLRHVSDAFVEDPLRVFRAARFAAQLHPFGFAIAPETLALMRTMCANGDLRSLSAERVWQELSKALRTSAPERFFEVLDSAGGLADWFPECAGQVPALTALWQRIVPALAEPLDRFGALGWILAAADVERLAQRLKAPAVFRRLATHCAHHGRQLADWRALPGTALLALGHQTGMLRQPDAFARLLRLVAHCAAVDLAPLADVAARVRAVDSAPLRARGLAGPDLGQALDAERARVIDACRASPYR